MFLEHVNLTVSDLDRSVDFYSRLLGLRIRWQRAASEDLPAAAHVGDERHYIAMFQAAPGTSAPSADYEAVGLNHFGFVVDDLDAARARLLDLGVNPHSEADYEPGRRLYFFDPDGIEVELVEYETAPVATP
ncbi:MAG: VOC family protein [Planctomycetota bacterium]|jgi:catechol 2,3-dioxygenase-like lactoylglutathione lyase family enzyme